MWQIGGHYQGGILLSPAYVISTLLDGETDGFSIDATTYPAAVTVIDTGTPANDLTNVGLDASNLLQSGTSPKMVHFPSSPYARWTPHNLIFRSQEFDDAFWTDTSISETANDTTAPDGTATADKLVPAAASAAHFVSNGNPNETALPVGGAVYTASVYAKAAGYNFVLVNFNSNGTDFGVVYDLSDGSFEGNRSGTTPAATTIEDAGNGWWRIGVSGAGTNLGSIAILVGSSASEAINVSSWTANGTDGIHVWGAQINRGYIPTPYLVTTSAARIGIPQSYDTAATQYGILVEPAATNLALYSDDFTNAAWTKSNMTTAFTSDGPDGGTSNASRLTASAGNATALQAITSGSSARITGFWVKRITGSGNIDLTQDNGSTWQTMTVTSDWTRVNLTAATLANPTVGIRIVTSTDAVDVWGFQHETGSVLTSTIPTLGSTVTRAADNITAVATSFPLGTSHTAYISAKAREVATQHDALMLDANNSNEDESVRLYTDTSANILMQIEDGGATQLAPLDSGVNASADTIFQITGAWATNDVDVSADGTAPTSDGTATMPTLTHLRLGNNPTPGNHLNGFIYKMVYVPRQVETDDGNLENWRYAA
jgi:hypothetical protein